MSFEATLEACGKLAGERLDAWLEPARHDGAPPLLIEAMRYAALGGGKRFRPFLVMASAELFGVSRAASADVAAALECVHCYSLVHDDLPAMDDDDLRRGRPTAHRRFGQATAILAGDALLTLAFEIIGTPATVPDPAMRAELMLGLAKAAGPRGMAGGQILDLAAEGRFAEDGREIEAGSRRPQALGREEIMRLQAMKTGALIAFGIEAGAILGSATVPERHALASYSAALGAAFQLSDDLLDAEGDAKSVGKATGKDSAAGKGTLVGLLGVAGARAELQRLEEEAIVALARFAYRGGGLAEAVRFMARRKS